MIFDIIFFFWGGELFFEWWKKHLIIDVDYFVYRFDSFVFSKYDQKLI